MPTKLAKKKATKPVTPTLAPGVDLGYGPGVLPPTGKAPKTAEDVVAGGIPEWVPPPVEEAPPTPQPIVSLDPISDYNKRLRDAMASFDAATASGDLSGAQEWAQEIAKLQSLRPATTVYASGLFEAVERAVQAGLPGYASIEELRAAFGMKPGAPVPATPYYGLFYPNWLIEEYQLAPALQAPATPEAWTEFEAQYGLEAAPPIAFENLMPGQSTIWTPEYASEYGIDLEEGYSLEVTLTPETDLGYTLTTITPEGWRISEDTYTSPEGETYTLEEMEEIWAKAEEIEATIGELFPEKDVAEVSAWAEEHPEEFFADIYEAGRDEQTTTLMTQLGFTGEEIEQFWTQPSPTEFTDLIGRLLGTGGWKGLNWGTETIAWQAENDPEAFVKELQRLGPTEDVKRILELMGATPDQFSEIFPFYIPPEKYEAMSWSERRWWSVKSGFHQVLAGAERYVFFPWRLAITEVMTQCEIDKEPEDIEFLDKIYAASQKYGVLGYVVEPEVMEAYNEWIDAKAGGTAIWWVSELSNPVFWVPVGAAVTKLARLAAPIPVLGKATAVLAKGTVALERGLAYPIAKPMQLIARRIRPRVPPKVAPAVVPELEFAKPEALIGVPRTEISEAAVEKLRSTIRGRVKWQEDLLTDVKARRATVATPDENVEKFAGVLVDTTSIDKMTLETLRGWQAEIDTAAFGIKSAIGVIPEVLPQAARGLMTTVERQEGRLPLPEVPPAAETLAWIETAHPGRLGRGTWRQWRGLGDAEATIKGARLVQVARMELGDTYADWAISQLDLVTDIVPTLGIKEGVVTKGIVGTRAGVPMWKGKPSYAWGDVFEHYKFYNFSNPAAVRWFEQAHLLIDDLGRLAATHGIDMPKAFYAEMAHYFPRGAVKGLEGVVEGNFVRVGAGVPGAKIPAMRHRVFEVMQEGLELGYKYGTPREALESYIKGIYRLVGNKQAIDVLKPLVRPLVKETEWGAEAILRAQTARKFANRAEHLEVLIQRIRRGETPHASTMGAVERNFPEMSPQVKELVGMAASGEKEILAKALLAEARVIKAIAQAEAAKAVTERVTLVEAASHRGFTEGIVDIPGIRNRVFTDITVNGKRITGQEVAQMAERVFKEQGPKWLRMTSEINRGLVTTQAALDTSAPFIQGIPVLGIDMQNLFRGRPTAIWAKTALSHVYVMLNPKHLKAFRMKNVDTYMKALPHNLITASDLSDFYKGLGMISKTVGTQPLVGPLVARISSTAGRAIARLEMKAGTVPVFGRLADFLYGRTGIGFAAWGEMARIKIIQSLERTWIRGGGTMAELVEFSHLTTGLISTRAMGVGATQRLVESSTFFAMRYGRGNLMLMRAFFRGGMTGKMVRRTFGGLAAGWTFAYCGVAAALGQDPKLNPLPKSAGGDGAEFMSVEIAGQNVGIPGFLYSFIKMVGGLIAIAEEDPKRLIRLDWGRIMADHPELRWLLYKTSPLVSTTYEMLTGRDVIGNRIDTVGDYLETIYENFLSIALQSIVTQDPPANAQAFAAELMGLRTFPEGAWDRFHDAADEIIAGLPTSLLDETQIEKRSDGTLGWGDLDPLQKAELLDQHPELNELYENAVSSSARRETDAWRAWGQERDRLNKLRDDAEAEALVMLRDPTQDANIVDLRNALGNIAGANFTRWDELKGRFPGIYEQFDKNREEGVEDAPLFELAYNEWYDWVLYGPGTHDALGNPLWSVIEGRRREWMQKWGEEYYDMIIDLREYGYAGKDDLLFKIWEDKQRLWVYWEIEGAKERVAYREDPDNLDIEARLIFLGYVSTIRNPEAEEIVKEWCEEFNVDIRDIPAFSRLMIPEEAMREYRISDPNVLRDYSALPMAGWAKERFLQENPEFYRYWVKELEHDEVDFAKVPTVGVEGLWDRYETLETGTPRLALRCHNPDLDAWLVTAKGYTPCYGTDRCEGVAPPAEAPPEAEEEKPELEYEAPEWEGITPTPEPPVEEMPSPDGIKKKIPSMLNEAKEAGWLNCGDFPESHRYSLCYECLLGQMEPEMYQAVSGDNRTPDGRYIIDISFLAREPWTSEEPKIATAIERFSQWLEANTQFKANVTILGPTAGEAERGQWHFELLWQRGGGGTYPTWLQEDRKIYIEVGYQDMWEPFAGFDTHFEQILAHEWKNGLVGLLNDVHNFSLINTYGD